MTAVTKSSRDARSSIHTKTSGRGSCRMTSETTFVSKTINVWASIKSRRLAHGLARRQLQIQAAQGREQFVHRCS